MKTILCYGDSNTHGTRPIDFDLIETSFISSDYRYSKDKRWTGVMEKELGAGYYVIAEGLNGRTTVFDDPVEGLHKNGFSYLPACLESHAPIDLVVIMLGTNDLKTKFSAEAFDIAMGIGVLVNLVQKSGSGPNGKTPEILILCPPPLGKLTYLKELFGDKGVKKSEKLSGNYKKIAKLYNCNFMDVGEIITTSDLDGVHYDEPALKKLGLEVANTIKKIIG